MNIPALIVLVFVTVIVFRIMYLQVFGVSPRVVTVPKKESKDDGYLTNDQMTRLAEIREKIERARKEATGRKR
jgi:hypothetical protein